MSDTTYVNYTTPAVNAEWLNEVNDHVWSSTPVSGTTVHPASSIANIPAGNLESETVQDALNELQTDVNTRATNAALTAHINDAEAAHESSAISFLQTGTGAVTTDVQTKLREFVSVKDFGILGNGTDESSKMQAALNYLNSIGGGELRFNGEVVRCDSPLVGYSNTKIIGTPGSTIDWSYRANFFNSPSDQGLFVFRGTAGAEILLQADVLYGDNKISVPNASLFSEGDLVDISINNQGSYLDTSVECRSGQLNVLTGVYTNTNNLVLDTAVHEFLGYKVTDGARIRRITPVENISIEGMTFIGKGRATTTAGGDMGLKIFFGRNVSVRNCVFKNVDLHALEFVSCYNFIADSCVFETEKIGSVDVNSYAVFRLKTNRSPPA